MTDLQLLEQMTRRRIQKVREYLIRQGLTREESEYLQGKLSAHCLMLEDILSLTGVLKDAN